MEKKVFSVGVRIEHKQSWLNEKQYGLYADHPALPAADYKLSAQTKTGKTLYSFCMCPGGEVIPAASHKNGVVTNGMSRFARDNDNANAALLVSIEPREMPGDLFCGFDFQRKLEESAFHMGGGGYLAPAQTVGDFLARQKTISFGSITPSYSRGVKGANLPDLFPNGIVETLQDGLLLLDRKMTGFAQPDAVITGPESRSTCPVRVLREDDRQSTIKGVFPIGEGAGYAGGITYSAIDGIKSAMAYLFQLKNG